MVVDGFVLKMAMEISQEQINTTEEPSVLSDNERVDMKGKFDYVAINPCSIRVSLCNTRSYTVASMPTNIQHLLMKSR